ncbi:hypothetical protein ACFX2B_012185 [Malus domestica]
MTYDCYSPNQSHATKSLKVPLVAKSRPSQTNPLFHLVTALSGSSSSQSILAQPGAPGHTSHLLALNNLHLWTSHQPRMYACLSSSTPGADVPEDLSRTFHSKGGDPLILSD